MHTYLCVLCILPCVFYAYYLVWSVHTVFCVLCILSCLFCACYRVCSMHTYCVFYAYYLVCFVHVYLVVLCILPCVFYAYYLVCSMHIYLYVLCILSGVFYVYLLVCSVHTTLCVLCILSCAHRFFLTPYSLVPLMIVEPARPLPFQRARRTIQHPVDFSTLCREKETLAWGHCRGRCFSHKGGWGITLCFLRTRTLRYKENTP